MAPVGGVAVGAPAGGVAVEMPADGVAVDAPADGVAVSAPADEAAAGVREQRLRRVAFSMAGKHTRSCGNCGRDGGKELGGCKGQDQYFIRGALTRGTKTYPRQCRVQNRLRGSAPTIYMAACAPRSTGTHTRLSSRANPLCSHTTRCDLKHGVTGHHSGVATIRPQHHQVSLGWGRDR